jgi:hypothetical protein
VYWPALVPAEVVEQVVHLPDGSVRPVPHPPSGQLPPGCAPSAAAPAAGPTGAPGGEVRLAPLGAVVGARSGDKGGNANIGIWVRPELGDAAFAWLAAELTPDRIRRLLPEAAGLDVRVHPLPNLRALNVVIVGLLGEGVASSTRPDPQAKGLGEYLRSRLVPVPVELLPAGSVD